MSKAILVIDMPKRCKDCFCYQADAWFGGSCTQVKENGWNKRIDADDEYSVQNWCPLRPYQETIPIELYEQVKGERDVALGQLKKLNLELFEKPYLKAIPIKWIEDTRKLAERVQHSKYAFYLKMLLEDWKAENEKLYLYLCDPNKNTECRKTGCHLTGGICYHTTHAEFAKGEIEDDRS